MSPEPTPRSTFACLAAALAVALALGACSDLEDDLPSAEGDDVFEGNPDEPLDSKTDVTGWTVETAITRTCTTSAVAGLAEQLIEELECMQPDLIARIDGIGGVSLEPGMRPYLQGGAARALTRAAGVGPVSLTSGLRTLPQQFLLRQWYQRKRCGIGLAAAPGRSQHESGLALDVANYSSARTRLANQGYRWSGSKDVVHFSYGRGTDLRPLAVRAFQRLHNLGASSRISVDGVYGPQTERALRKAPASGFSAGSTCVASKGNAVEVSWTQLAGAEVEVRAIAPPGAREIELWIGGELVGILEAQHDGEEVTAVVEVGAAGPQLVEAVAVDADGAVLGRGLADYVEVDAVLSPE